MNELTYILAILVRSNMLTVVEARQLQKAFAEGTVTSNLGEMITKVDKALHVESSDLEKISAKDFLNLS